MTNGRPEQHAEEGLAFIPQPLPAMRDLGPDIVELMAPMERAVGELKELNGVFKQQPGGFNVNPWAIYRPLRVREARLSSEIENTVATAAEVALADVGLESREEPKEVRNYVRAVELGSRSDYPIHEGAIRELHRELLRDIDGAEKKAPGEYRLRQVYIGDERRGFSRARFLPPPPTEVGPLMRGLVEYLAAPPPDTPTIIAIGLGHYQFETIHPFLDGNGRLGRMLITLGLCERGLIDAPLIYPSGFINANRQEYYDRLLAVSIDGDWIGWLLFFLEAVRHEARATRESMEALLTLRQRYIARLEGRALSQNIITVIDMLFERLAVDAKSIHERIGGSPQTANNYIKLLRENGTLTEITGRKKDMVFVAHEVLEIADRP